MKAKWWEETLKMHWIICNWVEIMTLGEQKMKASKFHVSVIKMEILINSYFFQCTFLMIL